MSSTSSMLLRAALGAIASFLPATAASAADLWSDPATWPGGVVPAAGEIAVVLPGVDVVLDVDTPPLAGLYIYGTLRFAETDGIELTSDWVLVSGNGARLEIGTTANPHAYDATITLTGTDESANVFGNPPMQSGTKFLIASQGGVIDLHGESGTRVSWTQLAQDVAPGDAFLRVAEPVDWEPGEQIVLAPSGYEPDEAEVFVVLARSEDDRTIFIGPWAMHPHYGQIETHADRAFDMRAEVGLLTRNILVRGDAASEESEFGGHFMVLPGGTARVSGVMLHRMGQMGHAGRYPFHLHMVDRMPWGEVTGSDSWIHDSSIMRSFNRGVVVHGSHETSVERVVAYDVRSHAFVPSEEGDEFGSRFIENLGITINNPEEFSFPTQGQPTKSDQREHRSSVFWLRNANQTLVGNHAVGTTSGAGFMYDGEDADLPPPTDVVFRDNLAHSHFAYQPEPHPYRFHAKGMGFFANLATHFNDVGLLMIEDFTAYKNGGSGIWVEGVAEMVRGASVADCHTGFAAERASIQDAVVVGRSNNPVGIDDRTRYGLTWRDRTGRDQELIDVTFKDLDMAFFTLHGFEFMPGTSIRGMKFEGDVGGLIHVDADQAPGELFDVDGSMTGLGVPMYITREPLGSGSFARNDLVNAWLTPVSAADAAVHSRIVVTSPRTGDVVAGSFSLEFELFNFDPTPGGETIRIQVNDEESVWTSGTAIPIDGLVSGWNQVELTLVDADGDDGGIAGIRDRINVWVPAGLACPADVDGNGVISATDLLTVLGDFGEFTGGAYEGGDATGDGFVDLNDLLAVLASFGDTCPG
ncbi:MAG: G8 domain-containing protein [Phycisphaerales bacterium]